MLYALIANVRIRSWTLKTQKERSVDRQAIQVVRPARKRSSMADNHSSARQVQSQSAAAAHRPSRPRVDRLLANSDCAMTRPTRAEFLARIESRRAEEDEQSLRPIRRGWCLFSPVFEQQLLVLIQAQSKEPPGQLRVENSSLRAQRMIDKNNNWE